MRVGDSGASISYPSAPIHFLFSQNQISCHYILTALVMYNTANPDANNQQFTQVRFTARQPIPLLSS